MVAGYCAGKAFWVEQCEPGRVICWLERDGKLEMDRQEEMDESNG